MLLKGGKTSRQARGCRDVWNRWMGRLRARSQAVTGRRTGHDRHDGLPRTGRRGTVARLRTPRSATGGWPIIDIEGGRQPMVADEDGGTVAVLTYSGEVYNFRELRAELAARGPPLPHPQRHRGRPAGLPGVGRGLRRPAERHVRLRHLGHPRARSCCSSATGWASSRSTTTRPRTACCSARSPRRSSPTRSPSRPVDADGLRALISFVKPPEHGDLPRDVRGPPRPDRRG